MESQITDNPNALALFFTEDVFAVADKNLSLEYKTEAQTPAIDEIVTASSVYLNESKDYEEEEKPHDLLVSEPQIPITFQFLGKNTRGILILVFDEINEVSTEIGNALLKKILKASKIGKDDFALVNAAKQKKCSFEHLNNFFNPKIVLAFGVDADVLEVQNTGEKMMIKKNVSLLFTENLELLEQDSAAKTILWNNLLSCSF